MRGEIPVGEGVKKGNVAGLDVVGANEDLVAIEVEMVGMEGRESVLAKILREVRDAYDYVVVDSPPTMGLLTINSLVAADMVLVPVQCEYLALEGLTRLMSTLERVAALRGVERIGRLYVLTMYDRRNNLARDVVRDVGSILAERWQER